MKKGFTLLELLIVIIIVGVLATLALPNFLRGVERARWAEAKSILGALRGAQIRYKAQHEVFSINNTLGELDVNLTGGAAGKFFTFSAADDPNNSTYIAAARRNSGDYNGETISINETGDFKYSNGVPAWIK